MTAEQEKINLLGLNRQDMEAFFLDLGEKPFRASQLLQWIHQLGVSDFAQMTNLSKALREKLAEVAMIQAPEVVLQQDSSDGTWKWLLKLADGNCIETVYIPERQRGTLCVSSQVGCALDCSFCSTAQQGFNRNLSVGEIISQVWAATRSFEGGSHRNNRSVTNVVLMGMGEPLANFDNVAKAMDLMMDDHCYGLSKRRVTLSTSGIVPAMGRLKERSDVSLAVSLHAPNNELRDQLVPINKKYPLEALMAACKAYFPQSGKRVVTFEYVMLQEVNDSPEHAQQLIQLVKEIPCKINLIPFNPFPNSGYERSSGNRIHRFAQILMAAGLNTTTRKTRGDDIDAACGQLVGQVADKTRRQQRRVIMMQRG